MKRIFTLTVLGLFGYATTHAQCVETPVNKVILAGDSWAAFMYGDQTINAGLRNVGHSDKRFVSNVTISENGADTWDFVSGPKQVAIQDLVDANPEVSVIHMSIGGNDMLGDWNISMTQQETNDLAAEVKVRLDSIIDFLQETREGMHVFWPGYTYPNFEEVIMELGGAANIHPFYSTWDDMGQPSFLQINTILNDMSDSVAFSANLDPQLDFVHAQSILQYHYGQDQPLGVAPGGTYAAFDAPLPLGYPDYPSPKESMRLYAGIFTDCFHLSAEAYLVFFQYQAEKFYQKALMDDIYDLSEGGTSDGSVTSNGTVSQEIKFGEEGGNEVAAVLTFNTQGMADTTLANASIFLRRESLSGEDPTDAILEVRLANGNFGTSVNVEAEDFAAAGDASGGPCVFGSSAQDGHWIRIDLPAAVIEAITPDQEIQFIISAPGFTGGVMTFHDASDPDMAPVLNLKYGEAPEQPDGILEANYGKELPVYPIPTTGTLTIDVQNDRIMDIEVFNVLGALVLTPEFTQNTIDIAELPNGSYILRITTKEGISTKRIIKR
ncbi:MAG: T9SS type A sorting domain-containing protein [Flavobacteriales bacterium]|nr:T9SS type A sorting domain-containing protein [Flavobacteriales bacterium]MCB9192177.1 T9SS type A sorting domain-containing protein [Flavobacteriales bacterium]MCB9203860.1 T9SS type A sorting domain-containing protein [Flavobacteriales bacterium]